MTVLLHHEFKETYANKLLFIKIKGKPQQV